MTSKPSYARLSPCTSPLVRATMRWKVRDTDVACAFDAGGSRKTTRRGTFRPHRAELSNQVVQVPPPVTLLPRKPPTPSRLRWGFALVSVQEHPPAYEDGTGKHCHGFYMRSRHGVPGNTGPGKQRQNVSRLGKRLRILARHSAVLLSDWPAES